MQMPPRNKRGHPANFIFQSGDKKHNQNIYSGQKLRESGYCALEYRFWIPATDGRKAHSLTKICVSICKNTSSSPTRLIVID